MVVLVTLTVGLVWWIVAWSFGIKAFDAFLLTAVMTVVAAAAHMAKPFVDQMRGRGTAAPERPDF
jgi:Mn2+/Fe2+ NRAMP family transporter